MVTWDDLKTQTPVAIYDRGANVASTDTSFGEFLRVATWDDEVILPINTFIATALAVTAVGAPPILVDCEPHSYNLDPTKLAAAVSILAYRHRHVG